MTIPKQWYSGTGTHTRSRSVYSSSWAMKWPLLRMLWWLSVAPLGKPVVPLVYWMLIGSSNVSCSPTARTSSAEAPPEEISSHSLGLEEDRALEPGQVRLHLVDHRHEVRALDLRRGEQQAAAGLAERILELVGSVSRIDVDQDHAELGRGVLNERPFGAVGPPHAHPIAVDSAPRPANRRPGDRPPRRTRRRCSGCPGGGTRAPRRRARGRPSAPGWRRSSRRGAAPRKPHVRRTASSSPSSPDADIGARRDPTSQ